MAEILTHAAFYAGWPKAWAGFRMTKAIHSEHDMSRRASRVLRRFGLNAAHLQPNSTLRFSAE